MTPELLEYIKQRRVAGAPDELIRSELASVKWSEAAIVAGLSAVTVPPAQKPQIQTGNVVPTQTVGSSHLASEEQSMSAGEAISSAVTDAQIDVEPVPDAKHSVVVKIVAIIALVLALGVAALLFWQYFLTPGDIAQERDITQNGIKERGEQDANFDATIAQERAKARDAARTSDHASLRATLELYFDSEKKYPPTLDALIPAYREFLPRDPVTNSLYAYSQISGGANFAICIDFETKAPQCFASSETDLLEDETGASTGETDEAKSQGGGL
ncbi:MAG: hypothetical protein COV10_02815 [Candidatus Vogelbacteria bacterium CG10_big_fil_rev_8_21_14_0_10_51_16]|uniref:Type II secretion system protein GspG C-terminal domain-containing protein n=1 Tax=Candidatus Vogelbacteria bacterium CG10_big_fil_rev_8_21_14_0_10_51_16 TaxID=1975045 RepID=A0A2H0RE06_9BACT|nr:MAG: hypothetical protein COV10_02815 [Candidatus Vogelbacteria bacterium CG10_big_fil_rev_8_21_14_0_10_51_16]